MCYAIRIANHSTQETRLHPYMFNNLTDLQAELIMLARLALIKDENVTFGICHLKILESYHNSKDGRLAPSSPQ